MKKLLTAIALACATQMAWSADPAVAQGGSDELGALQTQIVQLKAEAEIAKLKAEIANAGREQTKAGTAPATGGALAPMIVPPATHSGAVPMRALLVSSYDGQFTAVIDVAGRPGRVRKGDIVLDGWRVMNISRMGVELERGRRVRWLEL